MAAAKNQTQGPGLQELMERKVGGVWRGSGRGACLVVLIDVVGGGSIGVEGGGEGWSLMIDSEGGREGRVGVVICDAFCLKRIFSCMIDYTFICEQS